MSAYRNEIEALTARHATLEQEAKAAAEERDQAARMLEEVRAKARLPVLDNLRVASPCTASWADMTGDERVRHCGDCKKDVFNLSAMTRDEAQALIVAKAGALCVRYYQRHDGTILLADCTIGVQRRRRRRVAAAGAAALLAATGAGVLALRGRDAHLLVDEQAVPAQAERVFSAPVPNVAPPSPPDVGLREIKGDIDLDHGVRAKMGAVAPPPRPPHPATPHARKPPR
jgi:hypothetical protein